MDIEYVGINIAPINK